MADEQRRGGGARKLPAVEADSPSLSGPLAEFLLAASRWTDGETDARGPASASVLGASPSRELHENQQQKSETHKKENKKRHMSSRYLVYRDEFGEYEKKKKK